MMFNLFRNRRKENEALQRTTARLKSMEILEERKRLRERFRKDRVFDKFEWHYVDEIQPLTYPTKRTFEVLADSKVIESDFFNIKEKRLVCFADQTGNAEFENYIVSNLDTITRNLAQKDWSFVHRPLKMDDIESFNLPYFFPFVLWDKQLLSELNNLAVQEATGNEILKFYKYDGPVKTGFISITCNKFIFTSMKEDESMADFVEQYLASMPRRIPSMDHFSPGSCDHELEKETATFVYQVKMNLDKLKENGQFFAMAPTLLNRVEEASKAAPKISRMHIDGHYRILLPDYQNREIKLSTLTKSLYFLFLKHPKGVYTRDFKIYENELLEIYQKLARPVDIENMPESIAELSNADGRALSAHISRIKSAFAREFSDFYASKYYAIGGEVRVVLLHRQLLSWDAAI